jgi:hypothetical protein
MAQPFLALITPLSSGGEPSHPIAPGGPPPGVSHPIPPTIWPNPPGQGAGNPPGFWGGSAPPYPDQGLPSQPPGIWGGRPPNYPDQGLPGQPPGPSQGPGFPTHPIIIPPTQPGQPPLVIWGGGNVPMPTPPIHLPGSGGEEGEPPAGGPPQRIIEWHTAWTEQTGWIVVGTPKPPHTAPSGQ